MPDEHDVIVIGDVTAWELQGAHGVVVDRQSGNAMDEVADRVDGARVLDTG
jgi:hypothetical protein